MTSILSARLSQLSKFGVYAEQVDWRGYRLAICLTPIRGGLDVAVSVWYNGDQIVYDEISERPFTSVESWLEQAMANAGYKG